MTGGRVFACDTAPSEELLCRGVEGAAADGGPSVLPAHAASFADSASACTAAVAVPRCIAGAAVDPSVHDVSAAIDAEVDLLPGRPFAAPSPSSSYHTERKTPS